MKASIITIGDEILIGQTIDTNSAWMAERLNLRGIDIHQIISISDQENDIIDTVTYQWDKVDLILVTGGLGPTRDDITKKTLADYFGTGLFFDQGLFDRISTFFNQRNIPMSDAHRLQCYMPEGAIQLQNDMGTAPGMLFQKDSKYLISMPGVPYEMKWIFENSLRPHLDSLVNDDLQIVHKTIKTAGIGESRIADKIQDIIDQWPPYISMAYLPSTAMVKLRLTAKHKDNKSDEIDTWSDKIVDRLGSIVYGYNDTSIESALQALFIEKGFTLSLAESCTGGKIASQLVNIAGASAYLVGGTVAYSNEVKMKELNVSQETLGNHGAVSELCVREMVLGAISKYNTDLALAVSGIAGPGGGTADKPVGTVWIAWGNEKNILTKKLQLTKNRSLNIQRTTYIAINLLRLFLEREQI